MEERTATDRRFDRAMLEALHDEMVIDHLEGADRAEPVDKRIREWDHETRKWRIVHDVSRTW